jgi:ubiquinone/menaquinone biosynthesis C-methylase UbiE
LLAWSLIVSTGLGVTLVAAERTTSPAAPYREGTPSSPDGTGRFYFGREIAHVMSHEGAWWLERSEREKEEAPEAAVAALGLKPGMTVADLGAGTGYYSRRMARKVGPAGRVYAVDIQPEMLELLRQKADAAGLTNIVTVQGTAKDPRLPAGSLDLVIMVDVYHELAWPHEVMQALLTSLRPGGRIAFLEYRAEDPRVPIKPLHKMTEAQVRKEAEAHGLEWIETVRSLPWQHLVLFRKPIPPEP